MRHFLTLAPLQSPDNLNKGTPPAEQPALAILQHFQLLTLKNVGKRG